MNFSRLFFTILILSYAITSLSQDSYIIGTSQVSLEPGNDFFSLALQGYGEPAEGRYTLEWQAKERLENVKYITGHKQFLFTLSSNGELYRKDVSKDKATWESIGPTNSVTLLAGAEPNSFKMIAGNDSLLFAVSLNNRLWVYTPSKSKNEWRVIGHAPNGISMTANNEFLFINGSDNILWKGILNGWGVQWKEAVKMNFEVDAISANDNRLYVISSNQRMWETNLNQDSLIWNKIAYINGVTYKEPIKHIAIVGKKLFGIGLSDSLYSSLNRSENNLSVRCLTVKANNKTLVIIGADIGAIDKTLTDKIKKEINDQYGIPSECIMLNISHSHFTPVSKLWFAFGESGYPDERYLDLIAEKIVKSVGDALKTQKSSKLFFNRTISNIGFNRSLKGSDALYDPSVDVLRIIPNDGSKGTILFSAAFHPVFPNQGKERYTISANIVGTSREYIEKETGFHSIFLQGCAGDTNPIHQDYKRVGKKLAKDVLSSLSNTKTPVTGKISYELDSLSIPIQPLDNLSIQDIKKENENRSGDVGAEKNVRWANYMLEHYEVSTIPKESHVYIQIFDIGNWKLIGFSQEPVSEYAIKTKEIFKNKLVTPIGYCNEVSSYLPSTRHVEEKTYEGYDSFFWYGRSSIFPTNISSIMFNKIRTKKH